MLASKDVSSTQLRDLLHKNIKSSLKYLHLFLLCSWRQHRQHPIDYSFLSAITRAGSGTVWLPGTAPSQTYHTASSFLSNTILVGVPHSQCTIIPQDLCPESIRSQRKKEFEAMKKKVKCKGEGLHVYRRHFFFPLSALAIIRRANNISICLAKIQLCSQTLSLIHI